MKNEFHSLSLKRQCLALGIPLDTLLLNRLPDGWVFDGRTFSKPEPAAFAYFKSLGFDGTSCEGTGPLMLMKCSCLDYLFEMNFFHSREDSCMRYFEAQCQILKDKSTRIVEEIASATEMTIRRNFREVSNVTGYSTIYPEISEEGLMKLWHALRQR